MITDVASVKQITLVKTIDSNTTRRDVADELLGIPAAILFMISALIT